MKPQTVELFVVGTSQSVAPMNLRERAHVDLEALYSTLAAALIERGVLAEAVPLSTCGRLELYAVSKDPDRALRLLVRLMARKMGMPKEDVRAHAYALQGRSAVRHLLRVASGLDSVVHGEAQILGQVREAAHHPLWERCKGPVLHRLFEVALSTGKRVRSETEIGRGAASLAGAALSILKREMPPLGSVSALVLGAGETGALMARLLRKSGVGRLVIANRTQATAEELAAAVGGEARSLEELPALLREADLVVGAATVSEPLVTPATLACFEDGRELPRYFLDLAHPRDFDLALADVPGVRLADLEHVFDRVDAARETRAAQVPMAEEIVREHTDTFVAWLRSRENVAVLRAVREQVLGLARTEAERFGRTREERARMTRFARSLARTLLHSPTVALRQADPESPGGRALLASAGALFGLPRNGWDEGDSE